jgi:hypothetical protein
MSKMTTIYHRDGRERTLNVHEASRLVGMGTVRRTRNGLYESRRP